MIIKNKLDVCSYATIGCIVSVVCVCSEINEEMCVFSVHFRLCVHKHAGKIPSSFASVFGM